MRKSGGISLRSAPGPRCWAESIEPTQPSVLENPERSAFCIVIPRSCTVAMQACETGELQACITNSSPIASRYLHICQVSRFGQRAVGEGFRDDIAEQIEAVPRGVEVLVCQVCRIPQIVVAVVVGVRPRVGMVRLDDGFQLVGRVVGVSDDAAGLIGDRGRLPCSPRSPKARDRGHPRPFWERSLGPGGTHLCGRVKIPENRVRHPPTPISHNRDLGHPSFVVESVPPAIIHYFVTPVTPDPKDSYRSYYRLESS